MTIRIPSYRLHKGSGQALVQINGRRYYLGVYDTPKSHEEYRRLIAEYLTSGDVQLPDSPTDGITVNELILAYFKFAQTYYLKNGKPTDEIDGIRAALRRLRQMYGTTSARAFGPKAFKLVRDEMIQDSRSRKYINDSMARIRRMFKWAVAEEMIPVEVFQALATVPGLRKGRSAAKETKPIAPVSDDDIEATLPHVPAIVADMVRFQRLTGCRPQEVCMLRPADIDRSGDVWEYRPSTHKNEHRDRDRIVFLGPQAQSLLLRYLDRPTNSYCFSPAESEARRSAKMRAERKSPLTPSQIRRHKESPKNRRVRDHYDPDSYRRAVQRACKKAKIGTWSPNQLRHSAGTEIRRQYGLEAAQILLGHAKADVTQIYAERDHSKARQVVASIG